MEGTKVDGQVVDTKCILTGTSHHDLLANRLQHTNVNEDASMDNMDRIGKQHTKGAH